MTATACVLSLHPCSYHAMLATVGTRRHQMGRALGCLPLLEVSVAFDTVKATLQERVVQKSCNLGASGYWVRSEGNRTSNTGVVS